MKWYEYKLRVLAESKESAREDVINAIDDCAREEIPNCYIWGDIRQIKKKQAEKVL